MALNEVELLDVYDSLENLKRQTLLPDRVYLAELSMLEYFNKMKSCNFPYCKASMILVNNFFDNELQTTKNDIITSYNISNGTELDFSDENFKTALDYFRNTYRMEYLDYLVRHLIHIIKESSFYSDQFLYNNLEFILAIFEEIIDTIDLDDIPENESFISEDTVIKLVIDTLNEIDKTGRLTEVFNNLRNNIIPFDDTNIDEISKKHNVDIKCFSNSGFYYPEVNKIFYYKTNTLFDAFSILHEFGHLVSPVNQNNPLSEMFSIYFEKFGTKVFKEQGYTIDDIKSCELFRHVHVFEICSNLEYVLNLMFRVLNDEPVINDSDYRYVDEYALNTAGIFKTLSNKSFKIPSPEEYLNNMVDNEIVKLNNCSYASDIYNLYPYVLAYFITSEVFEKDLHELMIKWLEFGVTPEEVFTKLGYNINESSSRS